MKIEFFDEELSLNDKQQCEEGAKNILTKIKPEWNSEGVQFEARLNTF